MYLKALAICTSSALSLLAPPSYAFEPRSSTCGNVTVRATTPIKRENAGTLLLVLEVVGDLNVEFGISGVPATLVDNEGTSWQRVSGTLGVQKVMSPGVVMKAPFKFTLAAGGQNISRASFSYPRAGIVDKSSGYRTITTCTFTLKDIEIATN